MIPHEDFPVVVLLFFLKVLTRHKMLFLFSSNFVFLLFEIVRRDKRSVCCKWKLRAWSLWCLCSLFSRIINLLLTELARDHPGRILALVFFVLLSRPRADVLPVQPSCLVNKIYVWDLSSCKLIVHLSRTICDVQRIKQLVINIACCNHNIKRKQLSDTLSPLGLPRSSTIRLPTVTQKRWLVIKHGLCFPTWIQCNSPTWRHLITFISHRIFGKPVNFTLTLSCHATYF